MKLTTTVKLQPNPDQADVLAETMRRANAAYSALSRMAWEDQSFRQYDIHHLGYAHSLEASSLSAQVVVRCIAKVADAYKRDRTQLRSFRPLGAIAYDSRVLRWFDDAVSIWTVAGRQRVPFACVPGSSRIERHQVRETPASATPSQGTVVRQRPQSPDQQTPGRDGQRHRLQPWGVDLLGFVPEV